MITIHHAIVALHPEVKSLIDDKAFDEEGNEFQYDMESAQAKLLELQEAEEAAQQAAETHKQNAISKLSALGLSADEIAALGVK